MSLTALDAARASYLWQLRSQRPLVGDQLADLSIAFRWLLSLHLDEATAPLDRAAALMPPHGTHAHHERHHSAWSSKTQRPCPLRLEQTLWAHRHPADASAIGRGQMPPGSAASL